MIPVLAVPHSSASCSKGEDTIDIQEHDKNQMMAIMHQMTDKMNAMQMSSRNLLIWLMLNCRIATAA